MPDSAVGHGDLHGGAQPHLYAQPATKARRCSATASIARSMTCASTPTARVDEVTAAIGVARLHTADAPAIDAMLARIQNDLFDLAADLCSPDKGKGPGGARLAVNAEQVKRLEDEIDTLNAELAPLRTFVLAGGIARGRLPASRTHRLPARRARHRRAEGFRARASRRRC